MGFTKRLSVAMGSLVLASLNYGVLAGELPTLEIGSRVRVTLIEPKYGSISEPKRIEGALVGITESVVTLAQSGDEPSTDYPRSNLELLELNTQRGRRNRGAVIGFCVGAAAGIIATLVADASDRDDPNAWEILDTKSIAVLRGVWFGSIGAILGALVSPGERWWPIDSNGMQVGIGPGQNGEGRLCWAVQF